MKKLTFSTLVLLCCFTSSAVWAGETTNTTTSITSVTRVHFPLTFEEIIALGDSLEEEPESVDNDTIAKNEINTTQPTDHTAGTALPMMLEKLLQGSETVEDTLETDEIVPVTPMLGTTLASKAGTNSSSTSPVTVVENVSTQVHDNKEDSEEKVGPSGAIPSQNTPILLDKIYVLAGFRVSPGFFRLNQPLPPTTDDDLILAAGAQLQFSLMQFFTDYFSLGVEGYLGGNWLGDNAIVTNVGDSGAAFTFGVDFIGRFFPLKNGERVFLGASLGAEWFFGHFGTYTSLQPSARFGYATDIAKHRTFIEFGYSTPILAGLGFQALRTNSTQKPVDSRLHQFIVSVNIAF